MTARSVLFIPRARGSASVVRPTLRRQRSRPLLAAAVAGLWLAAAASGQNIQTVAGTGVGGFGGDGGPATSAQMRLPWGIDVDAAGNVFFGDYGNHSIRRIDAGTGLMSTVVGLGVGLDNPRGIDVDASGNIFIADTDNNRVCRVDAISGQVSTIAGNGIPGYTGDGGPATAARIGLPQDVAVDVGGNVYFASAYTNRVRRIDAVTGVIETIAGTGIPGFNGDNRLATTARLKDPVALALDGSGNLLIADVTDQRVRKVDLTTGIITTVAGNGTFGYGGDGGLGTSAQLSNPTSLVVLTTGELVIGSDFAVRAVSATGYIRTIAGIGTTGFSGDGGPATNAAITRVNGVAASVHGDVYIADLLNHRIRRIDGPDAPPIADAGADLSLTIPVGQAVQLDGSGSTDDRTPTANLQYAWTIVAPNGSAAMLTGASTATPSFVPDLDGDYTAELVVTDAAGLQSAPDQVLISIAVDAPPVAHAGDDQLGFTGTSVAFDGGLSTDDLTAPGNLQYSWTIVTQPTGSAATLSGATTATPSLVPDVAGDYVVQLVVTDESGQASPADETILTASVPNAAPTADAGSAATAATNVALQLDGTGSSDPDLDPLSYQWTLASAPTGSAVVLAMDTTATPTLTADLPGTYVVELIVNDGLVDSPASSVEIEAIDGSSYAQSKIQDVDALVASLPLTDFYGSGGSGNSCRQSQRARISKFLLRLQLRLAAWQVKRLDRAVQQGASSNQISGRQRDALRAIQKVLVNVDGWAERGAADEHGSGFRHDLLISASNSIAAYDCLELARVAVEAIQ